jgi:hypothetical protein
LGEGSKHLVDGVHVEDHECGPGDQRAIPDELMNGIGGWIPSPAHIVKPMNLASLKFSGKLRVLKA